MSVDRRGTLLKVTHENRFLENVPRRSSCRGKAIKVLLQVDGPERVEFIAVFLNRYVQIRNCCPATDVPVEAHMDVHAFLTNRLQFLRQLYQTTSAPYTARKAQIESGEPPYSPPFYEDSEPPFLSEWLEADQSLRLLGQMFVSTLAASLQLYLKESEINVRKIVRHQKSKGLRPVAEYVQTFKKDGWLSGYQKYFNEQYGIDFHKSNCDLNILEGLVLARNRSQHPDSITSLDVRHAEHDMIRSPNPFFVSRRELELLGGGTRPTSIEAIGDQPLPSFLFPLTITATQEHMEKAFDETEKFCDWLESRIVEWTAT
jgi:hypothetical protein